MRLPAFVLTSLLGVAIAAPAIAAPQAAAVKKGTVEKITVHGAALAGNLSGDSPDRDVFVYLPPSYATSRNQRYPVVYMLHGYGIGAEFWMNFTKLAEAADKDIAAGTAREFIVVSPDANTKWNGSMYSASIGTGDWETYIAEDLVKYIDGHYRTIATRESRGLGGHSMGGYGTVRIGMKRPDVFSSLYIMSACCLLNDPTPRAGGPGGNAGRTGAPPAGRDGTAQGPRAAAPPADGRAGAPGQGRGGNAGRGGGGFANVQQAQAAAWSANPNSPPDFIDMPVKDGELNPLVRAKYLANSPLVMIDQYFTNLRKYGAIGIEVGTQDTLAQSNRDLDKEMTMLGIKHTFETYEGDHTNRVAQRTEENVLPFFTKALAFTPTRK